MAPIKFEENIREKLQERELQPSKEAWNKLSDRLEKEPHKKNNRRLWMAVAAGFVGVLLVVSFLLDSKNNTNIDQIVVEDNITPQAEEKITIDSNIEESIVENTTGSMAEVETKREENFSENENIRKNNRTEIVVNTQNDMNTLIEKDGTYHEEIQTPVEDEVIHDSLAFNTKDEKTVEEEPVKTENDLFIDNKVKEVITAIDQIKKDKNMITADDIDALLKIAQRDISDNRILNSNDRKVDATALLIDVENELERSFRDRVFEALGNGFNKIRTAVVERNN
ncbi:MAG: hypothetical protein E2O86_00195 [Bacteroidetes bacterium]|nr:MAG: hypothetical protein E2O86_00195 [Bacteroidota bacterium]